MAKLSLDVKKCKAGSAIGLQRHDQREPGGEHSNKDIDNERTHLNYDLHNTEKISFTEKINERIKEEGIESKRALRSDANVMISVVIQAKDEFFKEIGPERQAEFFQASYDVMAKKVGKENIISANVHLDEKTPHLHFKFVPITADHKLRGGEMCNKHGLAEMHTIVADHLKKCGFDIQRGEAEIEKREHLTPQKYKLQELEREIALKEQSIKSRTATIDNTTKTMGEVQEIQSRSKIDKPLIGKEHVKVPPAEFESLMNTAVVGAALLDENKRLKEQVAEFKDQNAQIPVLKTKIKDLTLKNKELNQEFTDLKKVMEIPAVAEAIHVERNPHIKLCRIYRAEGMDDPTIAHKMLKRDGLPKEKVCEAMVYDGGFGYKINKIVEDVSATVDKELTTERAEREQARVRAEEIQRVQLQATKRKEHIEKNPHVKEYLALRELKMGDSAIAHKMLKKGFNKKDVAMAIATESPNAPSLSNKARDYGEGIVKGLSIAKDVSKGKGGGMVGIGGGGGGRTVSRDNDRQFEQNRSLGSGSGMSHEKSDDDMIRDLMDKGLSEEMAIKIVKEPEE